MHRKNISTFVEGFVPAFVNQEHPQLVVFLEHYLKYLERYNEVKSFSIERIEGSDYDPEQNGAFYQGIYLIIAYDEEVESLVTSLNGSLVKGVDTNAIYQIEDVVYSKLDSKYVLKAKNTTSKELTEGEKVAEVDIGEYTQIAELLLYRDIDTSLDEFIAYHASEYLSGLPANLTSDIKLLIKNIRSYYRSKGTEQSFKFLFRAIWGSEITFYYPKVDILRVSDGNWYQPFLIELVDDSNIDDFENLTLVGGTSGARADVQKIVFDYSNLPEIDKFLEVTVQEGQLLNGEEITSLDGETTATISTAVEQAGYWTDDDGKLSSTKVLQDNYFYQDFSYVIQSDISIAIFEDVIKRINHPAGFLLFGEFLENEATVLRVTPSTFDSTATIVNMGDMLAVQTTNSRIAILQTMQSSEFSNTTFRDIDENKESYPWNVVFAETGQFDNVDLSPFEDTPDERTYLRPDSELIINT